MPDQTKYTTKLQHKRILILGASSGIGYGLTEALIEHGAHVVGASSNASRLAKATTSIQNSYPSKSQNIHTLVVDLSNLSTLESELEKVFTAAVDKIGGPEKKLDHVIFTAGDALSKMGVGEMSTEKVIKAGTIRFFAPLMAAKYVQRYLVSSNTSSYVITTGSVSERPMANWSVVGAYAGGIHSMVRNLAMDLAPVRVNGVSPGVVDTELWSEMDEGQREALFRSFETKLLTGKVGRVEDVVEAYLGLLKDRNATGSMVRTDGGGTIV